MIKVVFRGKLPSGVTKPLVTRLVATTLSFAAADTPADGVTVMTVGDREMRRLNKEYRGKDRTTDVLSFGAGEREAAFPLGGATRDLGDIIISLPQVRRQAKEHERTIREEFCLMVVHGTLHLLGFDHETEKDERRMFGLQQDILLHLKIL